MILYMNFMLFPPVWEWCLPCGVNVVCESWRRMIIYYHVSITKDQLNSAKHLATFFVYGKLKKKSCCFVWEKSTEKTKRLLLFVRSCCVFVTIKVTLLYTTAVSVNLCTKLTTFLFFLINWSVVWAFKWEFLCSEALSEVIRWFV